MRVHIDCRALSGATINGAINNINGSISGGVLDVKSRPKRTNQEKVKTRSFFLTNTIFVSN